MSKCTLNIVIKVYASQSLCLNDLMILICDFVFCSDSYMQPCLFLTFVGAEILSPLEFLGRVCDPFIFYSISSTLFLVGLLAPCIGFIL